MLQKELQHREIKVVQRKTTSSKLLFLVVTMSGKICEIVL